MIKFLVKNFSKVKDYFRFNNNMPAHKRTQLLRLVKACNQQIRNSSFTSTNCKFPTKHFEEIQIPVPWGHVAGKWYGPKHERPLVGLHGWQDNAGTFDTLAPLLPPNIPFLTLDMPGHGLSSWLPQSMVYHSIDSVLLIRRLMEQFKWDKISLLAHSMSSINSFVFAALQPDKVDLLIGLDMLKPLTRASDTIIDYYAKQIEAALKVEGMTREPPCYEWDQLVEKLHIGSNKSIDIETCSFILQRNVKPSEHEPHKYYFSLDNRLKTALFYSLSQNIPVQMAKRIKSPYLFIKALRAPYYEEKEHYEEVLNVLKQNPKFEYHEVDGTHHVHLNEPAKIAKIINSFLNKWKL